MGAFIHSPLSCRNGAAWTELLLRGQGPHGPAVDVLHRKVRASGSAAARECLPTHYNGVLSAVRPSNFTRYEGEQSQSVIADREMLPRRMVGVSRGLSMPVELSWLPLRQPTDKKED